MRDDSRSPLDSVDRALRLIAELREGRTLSVKEAADFLSVAPSSAHRLLRALKFREFAEQDGDRGYRAGPALTVADNDSSRYHELKAATLPALELLHTEVDECAQLMVRRGTHIRFVDGVESDRPLRVAVRIGDQIPAHCSAGGKALLAELTSDELTELFADGLPLWPMASVTTLDALKKQLVGVRKSGYGVNQNETEDGVSGVGVVLRDATGGVRAALTLAIPTARFSRSDVPGYAASLRRAAAVASEALPRS